MKVLITGASSGIGRSLAYSFAKRGYDLVLVARDVIKLKEVKSNISNVDVEIEKCDLSCEDECKRLYNAYKDIDILVNNAGFGLIGYFDKTDLDKELEMINTNIKAVHILTKLYLNDMLKNNKGKILNVASIAGFLPGPLMVSYYSTKNYIVSFTEGIREELRKRKSKVQISILCPGPVNTNFDKVANVNFSLDSLDSNYVSEYTIKKFLKGNFYIIPGIIPKFIRFFSKLIPSFLLSKFVFLSQRRKKMYK